MKTLDRTNWVYTSHGVSDEEVEEYARLTGDWDAFDSQKAGSVQLGWVWSKLSAALCQRFGAGTVVTGISFPEILRLIKPDEEFIIGVGPAQARTGFPANSRGMQVPFTVDVMTILKGKPVRKMVTKGLLMVIMPSIFYRGTGIIKTRIP